jgi:hypothetical protein
VREVFVRGTKWTVTLVLGLLVCGDVYAARGPKKAEPKGYGEAYKRLYPGPVLPREAVALLANNPFLGAYPRAVDGQAFYFDEVIKGQLTRVNISVIELLPGRHTVLCSYHDNGPNGERYESRVSLSVEFEAVGGHLYMPGAIVENATNGKPWNWHPTIRDLTVDLTYNRLVVQGIEESVAVDRRRAMEVAPVTPAPAAP